MRKFGVFFVLAVYFLSHHALSEQLHFSKVEKNDYYQFNYQWLDHQKQARSMKFALSKQALFNRFRNFSVYKPELASQYISKNIVRHFKKNPIDNVTILYDNQTKSIELKGSNLHSFNQAQETITELNKKLTDTYLKRRWYHTFTTVSGETAIKPDHVTFAAESANDLKVMKPIILDKVSIQNIRKVTDYVMSFVQSIPYSELNSRVSSSGAGFNPPLKLLWENQGDCDSKVTLTAAILRSLMPRVKMVLVFIDNHALIGIDVLAKGGETTITLEGTTYLLGEPTGPAMLPLGVLDEVSELAISQEQYTVEKFH